jgi:hypothetical protein
MIKGWLRLVRRGRPRPRPRAHCSKPAHPGAGVTDRDQFEEAVRVGYERGKGSLQGYDPSR